MRVEIGMKRRSKQTDPKLTIIRRAMTEATTRHSIGGRSKRYGGVKPVTLAAVKFSDQK